MSIFWHWTSFLFCLAEEGEKNKDGNGNKRKNRKTNDNLKSDDIRTKMSDQCHFKNIEAFVAHEEIFLNGVFGVLSQVSFQTWLFTINFDINKFNNTLRFLYNML